MSELIEELSRGIGELADADRKVAAEEMSRVLLTVNSKEARNAMIAHRTKLEPVRDRELARMLLRAAAERRVASDWPNWLDVIDSETLNQIREGDKLVDELAAKLWREARNSENPIADEDLRATLGSMARLADELGSAGAGLNELVRAAVAEAPGSEASAEIQKASLELAIRFERAGLISAEDFAGVAITAIGEGLQQPIEPQDMETSLSRHVERWGSRLAPNADDASRDALRSGAEASPWLPHPFRETLILAGALREQGEMQSPYEEEEIVALTKEHRLWFDEGLALWIAQMGPSAATVGRALAGLAEDEVPQPVAKALEERFGTGGEEVRTELAMTSVGQHLERTPSLEFLQGIKIEEADAGVIIDRLAELYDEVSNNPQREAILEVARALGPLDDPDRKKLILEIVIPIAHGGKHALDLAIKNLDLCLPAPRGTVTKLRNTLRERAKGKEQEKRVDRALLEVGLIKRKGWFGGGREDVGEDR